MKKYKIKKGWHTNYFSLRFYLIRFRFFLFRYFKNKKIIVTISFNEDALYDFGKDPDKHDWNKAFGVTLGLLTRSNKNAVMMGWRALYNEKKIEITPYFNKDFDRITDSKLNVKLYPREKYIFQIIPEKDNKWTILTMNGLKKTVEYDFTPTIFRLVAPWFGGKDNENNGIGGVPNQDISYNIKYKIVKK